MYKEKLKKKWPRNATIDPAIVVALGVIKKGTDKLINEIPSNFIQNKNKKKTNEKVLCRTVYLLKTIQSM